MKVKPVLHRILVKPDLVEEVDESIKRARQAGILIELDKREKSAVETGTVLAIGNTAYKEFGTSPVDEEIFVGTRIYFAKYSGKEVIQEGERLLLINDEDVCGIIIDE